MLHIFSTLDMIYDARFARHLTFYFELIRTHIESLRIVTFAVLKLNRSFTSMYI